MTRASGTDRANCAASSSSELRMMKVFMAGTPPSRHGASVDQARVQFVCQVKSGTSPDAAIKRWLNRIARFRLRGRIDLNNRENSL